MSRINKFRAWDREKKQWVNFKDCVIEERYDDDNTKFLIDLGDRFIVEQYTGLFDGNGEEICEGDVLTYRTGQLKDGVPEISIGTVCFELGCFYVASRPLAAVGLDYCEIVSNIHEYDPEELGDE